MNREKNTLYESNRVLPWIKMLRTRLSPLKKGVQKFVFGLPAFEFIVADITDNCNLRCPFCINDFRQASKNVFMTSTTFDKMVDLLPLVPNGKFFLSCLFEPSLHPQFFEFLERIPPRLRKKAAFTTNLSKAFSDDDIRRLSRIKLHHINISLETFDSARYEKLRRGGRFEQFMVNLERIGRRFSESADAPSLRFITVILQANLAEIPEIVETCSVKYRSIGHELRYVYEAPHLSLDWKKENLPAAVEWERLKRWAKGIPYPNDVVPPPPGYFARDLQPYGRPVESVSGLRTPAPAARPLAALQIDSRGRVTLSGTDIHTGLDAVRTPRRFIKKWARSRNI